MKNRFDREKALQAFKTYAANYDPKNINVSLKISHTFRVADLAERIAGSISADTDFAWFLGLLHDIGRFEQVTRYGTFVDAESVDHAELGADILFIDGLISDFSGIDPEEKKLAEIAIRAHNKLTIHDDIDDETTMYCHILRDADKADIFRVLTEPPYDERGRRVEDSAKHGHSEPAREEIMACIYEHRCVPRKYKRTDFERVISSCCMAFELVYPETRQIVMEQGYIWKLMDLELADPAMGRQLEILREEIKTTLLSY